MNDRAPSWAKKPPQKCGTCKWLRQRSDGKPFYHGHTYACLWQPPRPTAWPDSWAHQAERSRGDMLIGGYMEPGDGKDCPCWERKAQRPEGSAERDSA